MGQTGMEPAASITDRPRNGARAAIPSDPSSWHSSNGLEESAVSAATFRLLDGRRLADAEIALRATSSVLKEKHHETSM